VLRLMRASPEGRRVFHLISSIIITKPLPLPFLSQNGMASIAGHISFQGISEVELGGALAKKTQAQTHADAPKPSHAQAQSLLSLDSDAEDDESVSPLPSPSSLPLHSPERVISVGLAGSSLSGLFANVDDYARDHPEANAGAGDAARTKPRPSSAATTKPAARQRRQPASAAAAATPPPAENRRASLTPVGVPLAKAQSAHAAAAFEYLSSKEMLPCTSEGGWVVFGGVWWWWWCMVMCSVLKVGGN
jgi:hypothetical protein